MVWRRNGRGARETEQEKERELGNGKAGNGGQEGRGLGVARLLQDRRGWMFRSRLYK